MRIEPGKLKGSFRRPGEGGRREDRVWEVERIVLED